VAWAAHGSAGGDGAYGARRPSHSAGVIDPPSEGAFAMGVFWFLAVVALVLGLVGFTVKGLFFLLIIGALVLVIDFFIGGIRLGRRRGHRSA
jgi:hypothetical protein